MDTPPSGVIFVGVVIAVVAVATLGMLVLRFGSVVGRSNAQARERRVRRSSSGPHPVMSRPLVGYHPDRRVAADVDTSLTAGQSGIVVNGSLPVNGDDWDDIMEEADAAAPVAKNNSLQYQYRLEALAKLINAGAIGQAEGIEKLFDVTRSGRKDSRYAQIRADLLPLLKKEEAATPIAGRPTAATFASDREAA
jgi:hypothetical protein